jgi:hypothetical protein
MIYGIASHVYDAESGMQVMQEISISANARWIRALAEFLLSAADELDTDDVPRHWHRHLPEQLLEEYKCDFIVIGAQGNDWEGDSTGMARGQEGSSLDEEGSVSDDGWGENVAFSI